MSQSQDCERCDDGRDSKEGAATCVAGKHYVEMLGGATEATRPCPTGSACKLSNETIGARVSTLELLPGFWRSTNATLEVLACKDNPAASTQLLASDSVCKGGNSTDLFGNAVCADGNEGPYCAVCSSDTARQGGVCVRCDQLNSSILEPLATLGAGLLVLLSLWAGVKARKRHARRSHPWAPALVRMKGAGVDAADVSGALRELWAVTGGGGDGDGGDFGTARRPRRRRSEMAAAVGLASTAAHSKALEQLIAECSKSAAAVPETTREQERFFITFSELLGDPTLDTSDLVNLISSEGGVQAAVSGEEEEVDEPAKAHGVHGTGASVGDSTRRGRETNTLHFLYPL